MSSVNKVVLIGNLGRDPELRYMPNGAAMCNLSIATTRSWKSKESGERVDETEWHRVVFYDRLAEVAGQYLKKGRSVYVEGRLKTRKWTDKDRVDKYTTEVIATDMQMLGSREEGASTSSQSPHRGTPSDRDRTPALTDERTQQEPIALDDDDIPF